MPTLLNYDPEKSLAWNKKAMEKKDDIIAIVDKICADGFSNIFFGNFSTISVSINIFHMFLL